MARQLNVVENGDVFVDASCKEVAIVTISQPFSSSDIGDC
jgi:hypothetical protein